MSFNVSSCGHTLGIEAAKEVCRGLVVITISTVLYVIDTIPHCMDPTQKCDTAEIVKKR